MPQKQLISFFDKLPMGWRERLHGEKDKPYFQELMTYLCSEYDGPQDIFPSPENVFRAFETVDYQNVKIVILGQDPYHGPGQAIGLSFAVPNHFSPKPPSLMNIFKEIASDLNLKSCHEKKLSGSDLSGWAEQGVLLLNTVLTVRQGQANSHRNQGWETFTDTVLSDLNYRPEPIIFMLWGAPARKKKVLITMSHHIVLEAPHPSPLSVYRGFYGCRHFSKANHQLKCMGQKTIDWTKTTSTPKGEATASSHAAPLVVGSNTLEACSD